MSSYIIESKSNKLTFLDGRFYFTQDIFVPSVTTILDAYPKDAAYFQWIKQVGEQADVIRDEAGRRGFTVHHLTEMYDKGYEVSLLDGDGEMAYKVSEWAMFERYVEFSEEYKPEIVLNEWNYVSPELGYAGTIDRVMKIDGKYYIVDIKTSNSVYPQYWLQLAAYKNLIVSREYNMQQIDGVAILWLNAKTRTKGKAGDIQGPGWQLIRKYDTDGDLELFNATHRLWLAANGDQKPRKAEYKLKHKRSWS